VTKKKRRMSKGQEVERCVTLTRRGIGYHSSKIKTKVSHEDGGDHGVTVTERRIRCPSDRRADVPRRQEVEQCVSVE
jgi:hypothetical protein